MEENINLETICKFMVIAYNNQLDDLKEKCYQFFRDNCQEIGVTRASHLPINVLYEAMGS